MCNFEDRRSEKEGATKVFKEIQHQVRDTNAQTQKLLRTSSGLTANIQQKIINNANPRDITERWIKLKAERKS